METTVKQQIRIPQDHELRVRLPQNAVAETVAVVTVQYQVALDDGDAQIAMAAKDPLFMADLYEVMDDFRYADFDEVLLADFEQEPK